MRTWSSSACAGWSTCSPTIHHPPASSDAAPARRPQDSPPSAVRRPRCGQLKPKLMRKLKHEHKPMLTASCFPFPSPRLRLRLLLTTSRPPPRLRLRLLLTASPSRLPANAYACCLLLTTYHLPLPRSPLSPPLLSSPSLFFSSHSRPLSRQKLAVATRSQSH